MHDGGGTFVHASFLLIGEAKDIKSFLNYMIFGINIKVLVISQTFIGVDIFSQSVTSSLISTNTKPWTNLEIKCH